MTASPGVGPLAGLKVLDLTRMFPGAFCSLILVDLGARVVKVEAPGAGDGLRAMAAPGAFNASHAALNRGKQSLMLDLRHPDAGSVLKKLVRSANVVIESHKPGQLDRLGLGYETMIEENPKVVWCSITGFGDFGPNAELPGHDITYLGYAGLLSKLSAGATTPPAAGISLPLAGLMGAVGILAALAETERTGRGARLDVNMTDSATWVLSEDVARAAHSPGPGWGSSVARNVYVCADGREVTVAASEPRTWATLCDALGAPDLAERGPGVDDDAVATQRVAELLGAKPAAAWLANPGLAGGIGPVNNPVDLIGDAQLTARDSLVTLPQSQTTVFANPIRYASAGGTQASGGLRDAPDLGADTSAALSEAGFDEEEIASLKERKVVG